MAMISEFKDLFPMDRRRCRSRRCCWAVRLLRPRQILLGEGDDGTLVAKLLGRNVDAA